MYALHALQVSFYSRRNATSHVQIDIMIIFKPEFALIAIEHVTNALNKVTTNAYHAKASYFCSKTSAIRYALVNIIGIKTIMSAVIVTLLAKIVAEATLMSALSTRI